MPTGFALLDLPSAALYHWAFHSTDALHVNHLVLLNTYLVGLFMVFSSARQWPVTASAAVVYGAYVAVFLRPLRYLAVPYVVFLALLSAASWFASVALAADMGADADQRMSWHVTLIGLGIALASLLLQLVGHACSEQLQAKPLLKHGLVAAPPLEYVSLLHRLGLLSAHGALVDAFEQAQRARRTALAPPAAVGVNG
jgi:hypothetical protein